MRQERAKQRRSQMGITNRQSPITNGNVCLVARSRLGCECPGLCVESLETASAATERLSLPGRFGIGSWPIRDGWQAIDILDRQAAAMARGRVVKSRIMNMCASIFRRYFYFQIVNRVGRTCFPCLPIVVININGPCPVCPAPLEPATTTFTLAPSIARHSTTDS